MNTELTFTDGKKIQLGTFYCIGKNYSAHAKELGGEVPEEPVVFIKPPAAYMKKGAKIVLPRFSDNIHHEVELVVVIGENCSNVKPEDAYKYIAGYAVGVDLTLRDIQNKAKDQGHPWAIAKGFFGSAPLSDIVPASAVLAGKPVFGLELKVNGITKQKGNTGNMERSIEELVSYLSQVFTLRKGDCIFTGTPEGVGRLAPGDKIEAKLDNLVTLGFEVC
jgi:2-keto-4-pentenoate hydratase/2-oxohepta-3-ene-1,7-dioic acid hydratase in catechol pathway